jgi:hypothetical protein
VTSVAAILLLACLSASLGEQRAGAASPAAARAQRMKAVVHEWSTRLNAGDNAGIARLFAVPALIVQGPYAYRLPTRALVAKWYATLPCSGRIVSIAVSGRYATVVFRLGNRGSTPCDAPGMLAAARFEIVNSKIVTWEQIPIPGKKQPAPTGPVA